MSCVSLASPGSGMMSSEGLVGVPGSSGDRVGCASGLTGGAAMVGSREVVSGIERWSATRGSCDPGRVRTGTWHRSTDGRDRLEGASVAVGRGAGSVQEVSRSFRIISDG